MSFQITDFLKSLEVELAAKQERLVTMIGRRPKWGEPEKGLLKTFDETGVSYFRATKSEETKHSFKHDKMQTTKEGFLKPLLAAIRYVRSGFNGPIKKRKRKLCETD